MVVSDSFLCSPRKLGKKNPFWRSYFSKMLVQPRTRLVWTLKSWMVFGREIFLSTIGTFWCACFCLGVSAWCGADGEFYQMLMRHLKDLLIFAYEEITLYWYRMSDFFFGVVQVSIGLIICENPQTLSPQMQECVKIPISLFFWNWFETIWNIDMLVLHLFLTDETTRCRSNVFNIPFCIWLI